MGSKRGGGTQLDPRAACAGIDRGEHRRRADALDQRPLGLHAASRRQPPAGAAVRRRSVAFFFQADYDAELACLPSCVSASNPARDAPTTIGAYRASRFAKTAG